MTDDRFSGLFESLEATFAAAEAAAEDLAADDLALSLRQDRTLVDVLLRHGCSLERAGALPEPVVAVAPDHVETATGNLVPLAAAVVRLEPTPPPAQRDVTLLSVLREYVRSGADVQVEGPSGLVRGRLTTVGRDHLSLATRRGPRVIALGAVRRVSRVRGSSEDAS